MKKYLFIVFLFPTILFGQKDYEVGCIGFYNFENLFDTLDTKDVKDTEFTPNGRKGYTGEVYKDKLARLSDVVSQLGTEITPDGISILGVSEVENLSVLEDFVNQEKIKDRHYKIVHYDSKDFRGIDVALIYNPLYFKVLDSKIHTLDINDPKKLAKGKEKRYTRDILEVYGLYKGEPMYFFVNHWPSRRGGEAATSHLREKGAQICKDLSDKIRAKDPDAKIIVMGDLNDGPHNASVASILHGKKKKKSVGPNDFYNPWLNYIDKGIGTLAYRDSWNLFDQVLFSKGFLDKKADGFHFYKAKIFNKAFMKQRSGRYKGYPKRSYSFDTYNYGYSDHFPVYTFIVREK